MQYFLRTWLVEKPLLAWMLGAAVLYGWMWPSHVLVADEAAYLSDAIGWLGHLEGCAFEGWSGYPPGTSWMAALFTWAAGVPSAALGVGGICWLLGIGALGWLMGRIQCPQQWAFYPALFLPGLALTRSLMSDLPSFALSCLFLSCYVCHSERRWGALLAGLCTGGALLFRETNLLWALPFLVGALFRRHPQATWLWMGFLLGCLVRMWWASAYWGAPLYVRDPGVPFSWAFLPRNLLFYAAALLVLCPGGLFFLFKGRGMPFWPEACAAVVASLGLFGLYGYDAWAKSGWFKGTVLQGRFVLPLLPLLTLAAAHAGTLPAMRYLPYVAFGLFSAVQVSGWQYHRQQERLTQALLRLPTSMHWSLSYDESRKYLNALYGDCCLRPLASRTPPPCDAYVHLFTRSDSPDWHSKNATAEAMLERLGRESHLTLLFDQSLFDGTRLRIWHMSCPHRSL